MRNLFIITAAFCFILPTHYSSLAATPFSEDSTAFVAAPVELIDVSYEINKVEKTFTKMEMTLEPNARLIEIDTLFREYKLFLEKEAREFRAYNPYHLSKFFLENTYRSWERFDMELNDWQEETNNEIGYTLENLDELDKILEVWKLTMESEEFSNEPEEYIDGIYEIIGQAEKIKTALQKQKREYLILEDDLTEMITFCNDIIIEVSSLQQHLRDSLFIAASPPFWKVKITKSDYLPIKTRINKFLHENGKTIRNYFQNVNLFSFWLFSLLIVISFIFLRRAYMKLGLDDTEPGYKNFTRIFLTFPILTLLSLILVSFQIIFPYHPLIIGHIITLALLISMRFILSSFLDKQERVFINKVIILLVIHDLEIVFWYFGGIARYFVLIETLMGILLMLPYIRPANFKHFKTVPFLKKGVLLLGLSIFLLYCSAFLVNLYGYLNLSVLFLRAGSHVPEFSIVILGIYKIIESLIQSIGKIGRATHNAFLNKYLDSMEKRAIQLTRISVIYYWFYSLGVSFEVSRVIYDSIVEFLIHERTIGTLKITIWGILALILIVAITFIITGILKIIIEELILKRSKLPRGVPVAISVTIRYFLIILGFMFALSAAGIELGKFSLLAGALGVGIGFGLQNIVNNFISGIILIYERPLQIGDTIEVENLLGQVKRIGVRSSNVRTYDGAEVVVPNGNLISNQLINWTLSDNKRRIEIKVGVSYGADPNQVLEVLENVALGNDDVLNEPPPRALFEDFGDSSLNFRLLFWVPYDIGIGTKSDVAIGVFNAFREHNIEIPFPQLDLHVKKEEDKPEES